jgi:hypothetical protein
LDDREIEKAHFFTLYKSFEDFQRFEPVHYEEDLELVKQYLATIVEVARFTLEPQFINTFGNFDRKLHRNVIKRCAIEPLEVLMKEPSFIAADV